MFTLSLTFTAIFNFNQFDFIALITPKTIFIFSGTGTKIFQVIFNKEINCQMLPGHYQIVCHKEVELLNMKA